MLNFYKKFFITMVALCVLPIAAFAQQISVVDPTGVTTVYTDLNTAITAAPAGSMVYLSGGGFTIATTTKITKPLTIMGIGHRFDNDNADGSTIVNGNFYFYSGSDGSALIGIHLTGDVHIGLSSGVGYGPVSNFLLRYCNVNSVLVNRSDCLNVHINQNYVRDHIGGGNSPLYVSNNIVGYPQSINAGVIEHNVFTILFLNIYYSQYITNCQFKNNIQFKNVSGNVLHASESGNVHSNNMIVGTTANIYDATINPIGLFGNNCYSSTLVNAFAGTNFTIDPVNSFQLLPTCVGKNAATDGTDIGIYGGTGFSDKALPPGPRIIFKKIAHQTDHDGNLPVEIKVSVE